MLFFFKSRIVEFVFAMLSFCLSLLFYTIVTDDYYAFSCNLASGQFGNYPYFDFYYLGLLGFTELYKILYTALPVYNWVGISFLLFEFFALYLVLRSLKNVILKNVENIYFVRIIQILFSLFFIENIISMSHTRFSLIFCGISLINLVFTENITRKAVVFNSVLFILGMCIRPESSIGMLLIVSAGYLIHSFNLKHLFKRFLFPSIATVALFTAFAIDWSYTDVYVKKVEPEIEYKIGDNRMVDISEMKSVEDSIKYEAAKAGMWFDMTTMTPEFLRSTLLPGINLSQDHLSKVFFHVISIYQNYPFIIFSAAAYIFICFLKPRYKKQGFKIMFFQAFTFFVIYALDYNGHLINGRHFLNIELISLLVISFYFFNSISIDFLDLNRRLCIGCLLFVLCGTVLSLENYKKNNDLVVFETNSFELIMKEVESLFSNRIIIHTLSNYNLFNKEFSFKNKNYTKNQYLMFDLFTYSLTPKYIKYLDSQCNCNASDPVAFFNWLSKNNALYITDPYRSTLTEKYMRIIHKQKIKFASPINLSIPSCPDINECGCEIRKIVLEN